MLKDLLPSESVIHIAGREYRVRYSLNALLCLEMEFKPLEEILKTDWYEWDNDTVIHLLHGAMCDMPWNRKAVIHRSFSRVKPDIFELGGMIKAADLPALRLEIADALLLSLPDNTEGDNSENSSQSADEGHLRAIAVDIMGMSEKEFWSSTHRQLHDRIDKYFESKGLKDMPVAVQQFDKED